MAESTFRNTVPTFITQNKNPAHDTAVFHIVVRS